jgi:hypothetical protein
MRIFAIIASFLLTSVVVIGVVVVTDSDLVRARGLEGFPLRTWHMRMDVEDRGRNPDLLFLGDSTLAGGGFGGWADQVARRLGQQQQLSSRVMWFYGLDFFHYYCALAAREEIRPRALVVLAHLRMFSRPEPPGRMLELCDAIPVSEWSPFLAHAFMDRGVSPLELLLKQALRWEWVWEGALYAEGFRRTLREVEPFATLLPPLSTEILRFAEPYAEIHPDQKARLSEYRVSLREALPTVRMMTTTLRLAQRWDIPVIVVATPLPNNELRRVGIETRTNIELLREISEREGAVFLDLTSSLPLTDFKDFSGHLRGGGHASVRRAVEPILLQTLNPEP